MKDNITILIAIAAFAFAGARLYKKFKERSSSPEAGRRPDQSLRYSDDDDYEPYKKK